MSIDTKETAEQKGLIERLFTAGSHFAFTKSRRHPTVVPYLFGSKQGTDIIDLEKTATLLDEAREVLYEAAKSNKSILFVGTKDEIATTVKDAAEAAACPYVTNRWIGGMMTNFAEVKKRLARLAELTTQGESGELERKYTKKERVIIGRELSKLTFNFGGIKDIDRVPNILVVVDPRHNNIAVEEALTLNIPVVGITSSDYNLRNITHPVVVNDSLRSSVSLVLGELVAAIEKGKAEYTPQETKRTDRTTDRR